MTIYITSNHDSSMISDAMLEYIEQYELEQYEAEMNTELYGDDYADAILADLSH